MPNRRTCYAKRTYSQAAQPATEHVHGLAASAYRCLTGGSHRAENRNHVHRGCRQITAAAVAKIPSGDGRSLPLPRALHCMGARRIPPPVLSFSQPLRAKPHGNLLLSLSTIRNSVGTLVQPSQKTKVLVPAFTRGREGGRSCYFYIL